LGDALFPIAQGTERDLEAGGEFLLGEVEGAASDFGAQRWFHAGKAFGRQGLRARVGEGGLVDLGIGHGVGLTPIMSGFHCGILVVHGVRRAWLKGCEFYGAIISTCFLRHASWKSPGLNVTNTSTRRFGSSIIKRKTQSTRLRLLFCK
jgi:hypothetical protein